MKIYIYRGSGGTAPNILICVQLHTQAALTLWKELPVPFGQKAEWAPQPACMW